MPLKIASVLITRAHPLPSWFEERKLEDLSQLYLVPLWWLLHMRTLMRKSLECERMHNFLSVCVLWWQPLAHPYVFISLLYFSTISLRGGKYLARMWPEIHLVHSEMTCQWRLISFLETRILLSFLGAHLIYLCLSH